MSKKLDKKASKLVRKAEDRATVIRRVLLEYNNFAPTSAADDATKQREIERAVVKYDQVHKAIKRIRRKMLLKGKQARPLVTRRAKSSRAE
jgi:hypothetical protein